MRGNRITRACLRCGASFETTTSRLNDGRGKFCSHPCARAGVIVHALFLRDGSVGIPLMARGGSVRAYAIVDASDAADMQKWAWSVSHGYAARVDRIDGRQVSFRMHRQLLGLPNNDPRVVDHINRNRLDNRRANLRILSAGNNQNISKRAGASSRYRNVSWSKHAKRWVVRLRGADKVHWLGYFVDEDEAGAVAREARARIQPYAVD